MAKVSVKLDMRSSRRHKDGKYPLVLYLYHDNKIRRINLKYSFLPEEWDQEKLSPVGVENYKHLGIKFRSHLSVSEKILEEYQIGLDSIAIEELKAKIETTIFSKNTTTASVKRKHIQRAINGSSLTQYAHAKIDRLELAAKFGNRSAVRTALRALQTFFNKDEILFVEFDYKALQDFCAYCSGRGNKPNTTGAYLRQIKALFNEAIDNGDVDNAMYPFKKSFRIPKSPKTKNRALRFEEIESIRNLDLEKGSAIWNARNYFLFMFNNMGINFIDLVQLKKSQFTQALYDEDGNIVSGRVNYERTKTGGSFSIKLTDESLRILREYKIGEKSPSDFIFPFNYENTEKGRRRYEQQRKRINAKLKEIAALAGINENLTTYYARHSWATIGKRNNLPITLISEALGHADTKTTEIYLASFDNDAMDSANEIITKQGARFG